MTTSWFYGQDATRKGPFSAQEMKALASSGEVRPEDTVWRDGVGQGVLARKVKNLFLAPVAIAPVSLAVVESIAAPDMADAPFPDDPPLVPLTGPRIASSPPDSATPEVPTPYRMETSPPQMVGESTPARTAPVAHPDAGRKARATAGRGAVIVGQDGVTVKFRKKCTTCGNQDSSWQTIPIRAGMMKSTYFCPKCRKTRDVEVVGALQ